MPTQEQYEQSDIGKAEAKRIMDHFAETFGAVFPEEVRCGCGWSGMSDECRHNQCPNYADHVLKFEAGKNPVWG
jgi:hypothetical protein